MSVKNPVKDYFSFGKRDRLGILIVVVLILLIYFLPYFFASRYKQAPLSSENFLKKIPDSIKVKKNDHEEDETGYQETVTFPGNSTPSAGEVFIFDPNSLDASGWKRLGLRDRTVHTIINYRNKGGKFRKPQDLEKIWGLPSGFYERVKNYIRIEYRDNFPPPGNTESSYKREQKKPEPVSINEADTAAFVRLWGIGSKLAARIINFRNKLGGFYSIEQVGEVYGLADSVFQKIRPFLVLSGTVKKINLNTVTKEELRSHPYFRWNIANALVEYRSQHGVFKSLEELRNVVLIDEALYKKILPYLVLGE